MIFIITEIPHDRTKKQKLHEIDANQYTDLISLDYFRTGKRKHASKEDTARYRNTCSWGPKAAYRVRTQEEWLFEGRSNANSIAKVLGQSLKDVEKKHIQETFGITADSFEKIPTEKHNLKDFYLSIGFDHKNRRYIDAKGNTIKYSLIKKEPEMEM
jgi:hypothetical protein